MSMADTSDTRREFMRTLKQIGWHRVLACLLILAAGLYLARFGWSVPFAGDAER